MTTIERENWIKRGFDMYGDKNDRFITWLSNQIQLETQEPSYIKTYRGTADMAFDRAYYLGKWSSSEDTQWNIDMAKAVPKKVKEKDIDFDSDNKQLDDFLRSFSRKETYDE